MGLNPALWTNSITSPGSLLEIQSKAPLQTWWIRICLLTGSLGDLYANWNGVRFGLKNDSCSNILVFCFFPLICNKIWQWRIYPRLWQEFSSFKRLYSEKKYLKPETCTSSHSVPNATCIFFPIYSEGGGVGKSRRLKVEMAMGPSEPVGSTEQWAWAQVLRIFTRVLKIKNHQWLQVMFHTISGIYECCFNELRKNS